MLENKKNVVIIIIHYNIYCTNRNNQQDVKWRNIYVRVAMVRVVTVGGIYVEFQSEAIIF